MAVAEILSEVIQPRDVAVMKEQSPMEMAQSFLTAGGDLESLEKMMDLQERFENNEAKKAFFAAMVQAQKEMPVIYEGRRNKQTNSNYAAYKDIVRDAKPIYTKFGLSVSFYEGESKKADYIKFCADVYHEKGHSKTFSADLPIDDKGAKGAPTKTKIHGIKSAMSYGRGILLSSIFNIPTNDDVDDDGNGAGNSAQCITVDQCTEITDKLKETNGDKTRFLKNFNASSIEAIPVAQYTRAINMLKAKAGDL